LNTELHNGDIVEIMASKGARAPSRDWLNQNLGYIKTTHARSKIKQWFTNRADGKCRAGREILDKFMAAPPVLKFTEREKFRNYSVTIPWMKFYAALGYGGVTTQQNWLPD